MFSANFVAVTHVDRVIAAEVTQPEKAKRNNITEPGSGKAS
jgi:hypothetical protein